MTLTLTESLRRKLVVIATFGLMALAGYVFHGRDYVHGLDNILAEQRMAASPRRAGGMVAFIAIDKASLDQQGVWPWPRSFYATMIRELAKAGANDIAFDIDFSARSDPAEDARFAEALKEMGGGVILPAFLQKSGVERGHQLALTQPIHDLAANAWIGAVNVVPDVDGVLRHIPHGIQTPQGLLQSIPSILAGETDNRTDSFAVDFSIDPATIPVFPVSRLLSGQLGDGALSGKSVLIGAQAIELKDYFKVPVHGTIPGPLVQLVAAETLAQGRVAQPVSQGIPAAAAAVALLAFLLFRPRRLSGQFLFLAAFGVLFEAVAFFAFRYWAIMVPTAMADLALLAMAIARTVVELDIRRWLLRLAALETRNTRQILQQVITDNSDAILVADEDGNILEMSVRVADVFRPAAPVAVGDPLATVLPQRLIVEVERTFAAIKAKSGSFGDVREIDVADGSGTRHIEYSITPSRLETEKGASFVVCIAARDITERRRQEEALDRLSRYDVLTGALRQTEFVTRLDALLKAGPTAVTVYSFNLHRFKTINATLGRDVGDKLLEAVVRQLDEIEGGVALVGRTGGDSFCLARIGPPAVVEADRFADNLIRLLAVPFVLGEYRARIGVHIGFASADEDEPKDAAGLLDNAEFALDESRITNGSGWSRFEPAASSKIIQSRQIERELWRSLERNEISVSYQPQVLLADGTMFGVEALVRWNSPKLGVISPGDFVEIAEANGFVEKLGQWVLWRACEDAMTWDRPLIVAVNVSPLQFSRGDIVSDVEQALQQSHLPPSRLQLEITESTFLDTSVDLIEKLKALKALGISLALDDFGTGYSSFGYLAKFPLDKIKVDQMFIRNIETSESSRAIIRSVQSLCEGLKVRMICEGVETEPQMAFLKGIGCEQGQGWLFGKPQPSEAIRGLTKAS